MQRIVLPMRVNFQAADASAAVADAAILLKGFLHGPSTQRVIALLEGFLVHYCGKWR